MQRHEEWKVHAAKANDAEENAAQGKLQELKKELSKRMHLSIREVGKWLRSVIVGHDRYYGVPLNRRRLNAFRYHLLCHWWQTLRRRSQRCRITWERMTLFAKRWFPLQRIYHPYPNRRLRVIT